MRFKRMRKRNALIIITAPSGAGKTSILEGVRKLLPALHYAVSVTTRAPRPGETDGHDYRFVTAAEFQQLIQEDKLVEYEEVYPGLFYGTQRSELARACDQEPVILDLDVKGATCLNKQLSDTCLTIFVSPPSLATLKRRLVHRGTESEASLEARLERTNDEMRYADTFDEVVVNNDLDKAVAQTAALIQNYLAQ